MESLKDKFTASQSYHEKLPILTLSPFTIEETQRFFQASNYMVKKSRKLKQMKGIMSIPDNMSKGRKISDALKSEVAAFTSLTRCQDYSLVGKIRLVFVG